MDQPPQVIVLGSTNTDLVVRVPKLPTPGETVLGYDFRQLLGGKGANQAVAAARASGALVAFITALGDDPLGDAARDSIAEELIDLHCTTVPGPSGMAFIQVDDGGENCIAVVPGANALLTTEHIDEIPDSIFRGAKVFLASLEVPLEVVLHGLQRAKAAGLMTILNPAPVSDPELILGMLQYVDYFTPNEHESGELMHVRLQAQAISPSTAADAAKWVVTLGRRGVFLLPTRSNIPAFPVEAVDSTAAGDCFSGAFAVAIAEGKDIHSAARFASAAAAISVTRHGAVASLPTRGEIDAFLAAAQ